MAKNASFMQILVADEVRSGIKEGRQWSMQDVQTMLLDESGAVVQVGVYTVSKEELGKMPPGIYAPRFAISVGNGEKTKGKVIPVFAGWTPVARTPKGIAPVDASVAAPAAAKAS